MRVMTNRRSEGDDVMIGDGVDAGAGGDDRRLGKGINGEWVVEVVVVMVVEVVVVMVIVTMWSGVGEGL